MDKRKPNVLLTVALALMVVAAVVCLVVFLSTRGGAKKPENEQMSQQGGSELESTAQDSEPAETGEQTPSDESQTPAAPSYDAEALKADLDDCLDGLDSKWQVVVVDLNDDNTIDSSVNCKQNELMVAADLTKLFVLATAYDQVNDGTLAEDAMKDYATKMIRDDNATAANELTKLIGGGNETSGRSAVNEFAASIGCGHVEYNRMFGESGKQNYVTAADCAELLKLIAKGECVSDDASNKMLELLTGNVGERIPGGVPEGTTVAHLDANITGTCCADAGVVFTDSHNFVLAIVCNDPITNEGSTKKCVEITKLVYSYLGES